MSCASCSPSVTAVCLSVNCSSCVGAENLGVWKAEGAQSPRGEFLAEVRCIFCYVVIAAAALLRCCLHVCFVGSPPRCHPFQDSNNCKSPRRCACQNDGRLGLKYLSRSYIALLAHIAYMLLLVHITCMLCLHRITLFPAQDGVFPNCTAYPNQFSFQHNVNDDQFLIFTAGIIHLAQTRT